MADLKITGLSAVTTLADTDLLTAVVDPGGTPLNRKITIANVKTVLFNSPTLVTPTLGVASATSLNAALLNPSGNILRQHNVGNAQRFEIYGGFTDASNYTRLLLDIGSNYKEILVQNAGSFAQAEIFYVSNTTNEGIQFKTNNGSKWKMETTGHWLPNGANNAYDVGASGNPCRSGYFGTSLKSPEYQDTNGAKVLGTQGASVADSTGVLLDLAAQFNTLLARLRAHGIIAT